MLVCVFRLENCDLAIARTVQVLNCETSMAQELEEGMNRIWQSHTAQESINREIERVRGLDISLVIRGQ